MAISNTKKHKMLQFIKNLFKGKNQKEKLISNQKTFVYCKCGNEMIGDIEIKNDNIKNLSFVADTYIDNVNIVHFKCSKCNKDSYFDFDHPVIFNHSENDEFIKKYKASINS